MLGKKPSHALVLCLLQLAIALLCCCETPLMCNCNGFSLVGFCKSQLHQRGKESGNCA